MRRNAALYGNGLNSVALLFGQRLGKHISGFCFSSNRARSQARRRQKLSWIVQPKDSWPSMGRTGESSTKEV